MRSWASSGKSAIAVADELGIKPNCLYRWRAELADAVRPFVEIAVAVGGHGDDPRHPAGAFHGAGKD